MRTKSWTWTWTWTSSKQALVLCAILLLPAAGSAVGAPAGPTPPAPPAPRPFPGKPLGGAPPSPTPAPEKKESPTDYKALAAKGRFHFDFNKAQIGDVVKVISEITQKNFIIPE